MKVAVFGPVYIKTQIDLQSTFNDEWGVVLGKSSTTKFAGSAIETATRLRYEHEVQFITSLDVAFPSVVSMLERLGIKTDYTAYESHGTGFSIDFVDREVHNMSSYAELSKSVEQMKIHEDELFKDLSMMIVTTIDPEVIKLCKKHKVPLTFVYSSEEDLDELSNLDPNDQSGVNIVATDVIETFLKEVLK